MSEGYNAKAFSISRPTDGVLLVQINRPPANAFTADTWDEFRSVFEAISADTSVRAVVLASKSDKFFTAGLDLKTAGSVLSNDTFIDPARKAFFLRQFILNGQRAMSAIEACPQPVIAAISGVAFGLAIDMTSACDIRYCSSDAKFSIKEIDIGLAADIGTLARLPKIVGNESLARELAFTARPFDAEEALRLGFVSRVVGGGREGVTSAAIETAKLIASKSPVAVTGTKHLMIHARDNKVRENLEYTAAWNSAMLQTKDQGEALKATLSRQTPEFKPLQRLNGKL